MTAAVAGSVSRAAPVFADAHWTFLVLVQVKRGKFTFRTIVKSAQWAHLGRQAVEDELSAAGRASGRSGGCSVCGPVPLAKPRGTKLSDARSTADVVVVAAELC